MDHRLPATLEMAREFTALFVNRRACTVQSTRPHPETGRHYYYRPKPKDGGLPTELTPETVRSHMAGELTIGLYAINPETQRSKWVAIDADCKTALEDLIRVQRQLQEDGVEAALGKSSRGGHLWRGHETTEPNGRGRTAAHRAAPAGSRDLVPSGSVSAVSEAGTAGRASWRRVGRRDKGDRTVRHVLRRKRRATRLAPADRLDWLQWAPRNVIEALPVRANDDWQEWVDLETCKFINNGLAEHATRIPGDSMPWP